MTEAENKRLNELLAKKAAEEKHDRDFFKEVRARRAEVLAELRVEDSAKLAKAIDEISSRYGISRTELLNHIGSEKQISYYRNTHTSITPVEFAE